MPCGGVAPCKVPGTSPASTCFWCGRPGCGHFYEEFDCYVHAICFLRDLRDRPDGEASIALSHEHDIVLDTTHDKYPVLTPRRKTA